MAFLGSGVLPPDVAGVTITNDGAGYTGVPYDTYRGFTDQGFGPTEFSDAYLDRDGAREKSLNLMKEWLTPRQLEQYEDEGCFDVKGSNGGRYRISNKGTTFNVRELRRTVLGNLLPGDKLCFQPAGVYSQGDVMLAQKIMLERDEPGALKIANRSHT